MSRVRRYTSPCLLMPSSLVLPPEKSWAGTRPSQAASCRPFLKLWALPMLATRALAVIGPMPSHDLALERDDLLVQLFQVRLQRAQQRAHQPWQAVVAILQDLRQSVAQPRDALRQYDAELAE